MNSMKDSRNTRLWEDNVCLQGDHNLMGETNTVIATNNEKWQVWKMDMVIYKEPSNTSFLEKLD